MCATLGSVCAMVCPHCKAEIETVTRADVTPNWFGLTDRELSVVQCVCEGMRNAEIAKALGITLHTTKRHLYHVFNKTGQGTRLELLLFAQKHIPQAAR
jgi:DNA-binding CsgD family transcriptional regulator